MLVYDDKSVRQSGPPFDPLRVNAVKAYMKHYDNYLYLTFMLSSGNVVEKHQASKELAICERKLEYWRRQPHFIQSEANAAMIQAKRRWG